MTDKKIKFSIVLPAYNVEQYIIEALECLGGQDYPEYEVIVVDDCATDATGELAEQFAAESGGGKFSVIHQPQNRGVSEARNSGMDAATGEYILFLDPDDYYEPTLLSTLYAVLQEKQRDIVLFGYTEDYLDADGKMSYRVTKSLPGADFCGLCESLDEGGDNGVEKKIFADCIVRLERETMYGYPWNKAYRLDYLRDHGIRFPKITHIEDIMFNIAAFEEIASFALLPEVLYHYRNQGQVRLTGKYLADYLELQKTRIRAFLEQQCRWREEKFEELDQSVLEAMAGFYFRSLQSAIVRSISHGDGRREIFDWLEQEMEDPLYGLLKDHLTGGKAVKILYEPLARGRLVTAYLVARLIGVVQRFFPGVYARLKQNR